MPYQTTRRFTIAGLCLLLVFAFTLSGCGKKGPLYMPPAEKTPAQK